MTIRALLIDDDPDTRAIVALALDLHPRFTASAVSRLDAAGLLRRGTEQFDVILLDMKLSDMSVGALIATVRQWSASAVVPVLILSPQASDNDPRTCRSTGAQGAIGKPFDPIALPDRVVDLLEPYGSVASAGRQ
ncbi:MAG: response regulator [Sphingomonas bacterium]|nr:response regulator [Sphingomonas bacterium]